MKNFCLVLIISFYSLISNSYDKFDADVCEANTDDSARIKCYRNAGFPNECQNQESELSCYRNITNKLQKEAASTQSITPGTYYR